MPVKLWASLVAQMVESACRRPGFNPWVGEIPRRRDWLPTSVFLPGESHGQRSLMGYSPWGSKVRHNWSDSAHMCARARARARARAHTHTHTHTHSEAVEKLVTSHPAARRQCWYISRAIQVFTCFDAITIYIQWIPSDQF